MFMTCKHALPHMVSQRSGCIINVSSTASLAARPSQGQAIILLRPSERDLISRYRAAGFCGYLIKPVRRESLAERVRAAAAPRYPRPVGRYQWIQSLAACRSRRLIDPGRKPLRRHGFEARKGCG